MTRLFSYLACFILIAGCVDNRSVSGPYPQQGLATWYSSNLTASGERFDSNSYTCAMRKRGFGSYYRVCNVKNNKCVTVRHNNFGPSLRKFKEGRIIDLSKAAFSSIAELKEGVIKVTVVEVEERP